MSEPYVGEIRMFAANFAPRDWAFCDGQLLAVSQNDALFSLLGTIYGGDGRTTFGLPDLRGRIPIHVGTGPGLSARALGSKAGQQTVTLTSVQQLPSHNHLVPTTTDPAASLDPLGKILGQTSEAQYREMGGALVDMHPDSIVQSTGSGLPHSNLQPFLGINFIMALFGIYPSRT